MEAKFGQLFPNGGLSFRVPICVSGHVWPRHFETGRGRKGRRRTSVRNSDEIAASARANAASWLGSVPFIYPLRYMTEGRPNVTGVAGGAAKSPPLHSLLKVNRSIGPLNRTDAATAAPTDYGGRRGSRLPAISTGWRWRILTGSHRFNF